MVVLPFAPAPWLLLEEEGEGEPLRLQEVRWRLDKDRFVCQLEDDLGADEVLGNHAAALKESQEARGWSVRNE